MSDRLPKTHCDNTTHIDLVSRKAFLTVQWTCELDRLQHPITHDNELKFFMCGEESFMNIAKDIGAAQNTVDLICWGFDPAMELARTKNAAWPRGWVYGSILSDAAARGVKVRLLVWYDRLPSYIQNNLPGYTGDQRKGYMIHSPTTSAEDAVMAGLPAPVAVFGNDPRTPEQARQEYCVQWWRDALMGKIENLQVKFRKGNSEAILRSLKDPHSPEDLPSTAAPSHGGLINEYDLIVKNGTHHQKTILIDYAFQGGQHAVGYVMGLNSVTDYWDTTAHLFDTPLRETDWDLKSETAQKLGPKHPISRDPYQDYVCRLRGNALQDVHHNFLNAWLRAKGQAHPNESRAVPPSLPRVKEGSTVQIVRTQPEEADKTIKNAYYQASGLARNYLYIENQYFFYEPWVRQLKEKRATFIQWSHDAGRAHHECALLHLFAVIPRPEDAGMVPRTYDMVKSLGEGQSMATNEKGQSGGQQAVIQSAHQKHQAQLAQWRKMTPQQQMDEPSFYPTYDPLLATSNQIKEPVKNPTTGEIESMGLKVLLASLITQNKGPSMPEGVSNFRQVYIHSKLMLIDDSFITLGSANMNLRSMAGDSEINMLTDDAREAAQLRQRVWEQHSGGYRNADGGDGSQSAVAKAFDAWKRLMKINDISVFKGDPIIGFLIPFRETREVTFRHG